MIDAMRRALTRVGVLTAHPAAFGVLLLYASLWFAFDRESLNWHAIAIIATMLAATTAPNAAKYRCNMEFPRQINSNTPNCFQCVRPPPVRRSNWGRPLSANNL